MFMVHDGEDGYQGDPKSLETWAKVSERSRQTMYHIYATRSGKDPSYWEKICSKDTIFIAGEIVAIGLADEILEIPDKTKR